MNPTNVPGQPNEGLLAEYLEGILSDERAAEVAAFVERSPEWSRALDRLAGSDQALISAVRRAVPVGDSLSDAAFRDVIRRVKEAGISTMGGPRSAGEETIALSHPPGAGSAPGDAGRPTDQEQEPLGTIRDYRLVAKLGQGGMGTVYKAVHTRLGKTVAVKLLPPERLLNPDAIGRFEREMLAVGGLEHPHLVRASDAGEAEGRQFLVMEYVDGADLSTIVGRLGPLPAADACEAVRQAALGLQYAHEQHLVHRDVKPSNVMVNRNGQVKVLDLGLALVRAQQQPELTAAGQLMGTLDYMAPEQCDDSHAVDVRADVYGLGATLYKLLCGRAPFPAKEFGSPSRQILALATRPVRPLAEQRPDLAAALCALIERLLSKDPADRLPTPAAVAEALAPYCAGSDLSALVTKYFATSDQASPPARGLATEPHLSAPSTETKPAPAHEFHELATPAVRATVSPISKAGRGGRRRRILIGLAALAASVVLAGVILIIRDREGRVKQTVELEPGDALEIQEGGLSQAATTTAAAETGADPAQQKNEPPAASPSFDDLRREDIPAYELAAAGFGDPSQAPPELVAVRGDSRLRHWHYVSTVAYSPDGETVVSGSHDGTIVVWDAKTGERRRVLSGPQVLVNQVILSPDGQTLVSAPWRGLPSDPEIRVWDLSTGEIRFVITAQGGKCIVAFSPDGQSIASAGATDGAITITDASSGLVRKSIPVDGANGEAWAWCLAFDHEGKRLALGDTTGGIGVWDAETGELQRKWQAHEREVICLAFNLNGQRLISCSHDGHTKHWDLPSGDEVLQLGNKAGAYSIALSRDGHLLASGSNHLSEIPISDHNCPANAVGNCWKPLAY
jgi:serine/threonine protein kinase